MEIVTYSSVSENIYMDKKKTIMIAYRPISRVVIGREVDYRSRLIYVRYCFTNTTLCL